MEKEDFNKYYDSIVSEVNKLKEHLSGHAIAKSLKDSLDSFYRNNETYSEFLKSGSLRSEQGLTKDSKKSN